MAKSQQASSPASVLYQECVSQLRELQNADGGWGFHTRSVSRVEPTAWAMRALFDLGGQSRAEDDRYQKAVDFLRASRLSDGSWPASPEISTGSWVTSHACAVLAGDERSAQFVKTGLTWLCEDFPRDSSPFQRFLRKVFASSRPATHDDSLRGWGWTPRTASWVEPTAFALLALGVADSQLLPSNAEQRRELAVGLLYDRMCPGGGWNCGNPRVYGVAGDALILPTCWALLALRDAPAQPGRVVSLSWLQENFLIIESAGSHAVARTTLEHYGLRPPQVERNLEDFSADELRAEGTHVLAWVCLALNPGRRWFAPANTGGAQ